MAKGKSKHITVTVGGIHKIVARVFIQSDGSPAVEPIPLEFEWEGPGAPYDETDPKITQVKTSLHLSKQSPNFNFIKTFRRTSQGNHAMYQATKAIKETNRFALIFSRRFSDMWPERFNSTAKAENRLELQEFDPTSWTMIVHFAWSTKGQSIDKDLFWPWSHKVMPLGDTELHIFYWFIRFPANGSAQWSLNATLPPEQLGGKRCEIEDGLTQEALCLSMRQHDQVLLRTIVEQLASEYEDPVIAKQIWSRMTQLTYSKNMSDREVAERMMKNPSELDELYNAISGLKRRK